MLTKESLQFLDDLKKNNNILFPGTQQVTETVQAFNFLSLEASLPIIFVKGKFQFLLTPAFVLPKNLLKVSGKPDQSESGENMFYTTAGLKYTF